MPEGWEWCRFGSLLFNRDAERVPLSVAARERLEKKYDYYGASGVIDAVDKYLFDKPLLLIGEDGANLVNRTTPIAFMARGKYWVNNHAHVLDGFDEVLLEYVALFINAISLAPYITGTAQPKMNQERMNSILVAVPPLAEQRRIVERVVELMPLVEEYGALEDEREALDGSLPEHLRKSILQEAVRGKLVPQDPADEPASALLARIRAERAAKIAAGELKAPKGGDSVIYLDSDGAHYEKRIDAKGRESEPVCIEDEIPFDVPDGWEWVRLENIGMIVGGGTPKTADASLWSDSNDGVPWLTPADMKFVQGKYVSHGERYISQKGLGSSSSTLMPQGSVLMSSRAPIGYLAIAANPIATNQGFKSIVPQLPALAPWLYTAIDARMDDIKERATGTTFKEISGSEFGRTLIPIPPLDEQKRIVFKVDELTTLTSQLLH